MGKFLVDGPPFVNRGVLPLEHAWIEHWRRRCHSGRHPSHPAAGSSPWGAARWVGRRRWPHDIPPRRWCRDTQLAEQLVEVPTTVSYSSLFQRTVEQHVDIPVPGGGGGPSSGLQGFSSGQRSTASPSRKRISERIVEQIVDPVSRGGLHGSSFSYSPAGDEERADEPGKGFFRTFPQIKKKCEGCSALGVGTASALQLMDGGGSAGGLRRVGEAQGEARWQDVLLEQTY